jgi:leucyl-tRNA synthetase
MEHQQLSQYDFKTVEQKWQDIWYSQNTYQADNQSSKPKKYILVEFPFPSGASLHMGHLFRYTVPDIYSRFLRHQGYNVLFPMGWDAFGLPAEEYARKTGKNPRVTTEENIAKFKEQIKKFGFGVDWSREFSTTDKEYYKWTQWMFKKFYEAGLAEQREVELWYCEALGTVLANEEVYDGENGTKLSERGDHPVIRKKMKQWVLKITEYGDKLLDGLEETEFPEHIKAMQRSWIGKSEGTIVNWELVPEGYSEMIAKYPMFDFNANHDPKMYEKIVRERAVLIVRLAETDQYITYSQHRYQDDYHYLPGGGVEYGETPQIAGVREVYEELGLENLHYVTDLGEVSTYSKFEGQNQRSIEHYFLYEITEDDFNARKQAEIDDKNCDMYGVVELSTIDDLRNNNWQQLQHILDNLEEYNTTGSIKSLKSINKDILLATTNKSKLKRFHNYLNFNGVHLHSPTSELYEVNVIENGENELENAKIKAKAFFDMQISQEVKMPTLAQDTGIYLEDVPVDMQPGEKTKGAAGVGDDDSLEVVFDKMTQHYINLVDTYGTNGELNAYFLDVYAMYDGIEYYTAEVKREVIITNQVHDTGDLHFPLCSLYKTKLHGKYYNSLSKSQMDEFLSESMTVARKLLYNYVFSAEIDGLEDRFIRTFTTRVDTLPSSTFVVLSPEYPNLLEMTTTEYIYAMEAYLEQAKNKTERERQINKEKTGAFTGRFVRNPLTNELCPVWVSDFVLGGYGTGAVMGDAHDERDVELALEKDIFLAENVSQDGAKRKDFMELLKSGDIFTDKGLLYKSAEFSGLSTDIAKTKITDKLIDMKLGERTTNWRFRDWVFSRQRYWGEPFPIQYDLAGNISMVKDEDLPLELPELDNFLPSNDGRSPLADSDWLNIVDDTGKLIAVREADTMPNWAGSSWYYLRFCDVKNSQEFASQEALKYWLPVDKYFGGGEHTTMHLLYSRFWHKFLYDEGLVPTSEPYMSRINGGIFLGPDGSKMSKSKGNVIQPDDKLDNVGADALRLYTAFIGPYEATVTWQDGGLVACKRLVDTVWKLQSKVDYNVKDQKLESIYHSYLKEITHMLEEMKTNTAVSQLMILTNALKEVERIPFDIWRGLVVTIAPFAPHLAEELWSRLDGETSNVNSQYVVSDNAGRTTISPIKQDTPVVNISSVHYASWPKYDEAKIVLDTITLAVQVNGKVRAEIVVSADQSDEEILNMAKAAASKYLEGKDLKFHKIIPGKLVTLVV